MPSFFVKAGWIKLKKDLGLDDDDPCVSKMNLAIKKFLDLDNQDISASKIDLVDVAIDKLQKCMVKTATQDVKKGFIEMRADAKKFRNLFTGAVDKNYKGFFDKTGWINLKREHDLLDNDTCVVKMNTALKTFHAVDEAELSIGDLAKVETAVGAFQNCMKKTAPLAVKNAIDEMVDQVNDFRTALAGVIKKGLA